MGKFVRIFIAVMLVLSFVVLARYEAAGASNPVSGSEQSLQVQVKLSATPVKNDDCKDEKNKNEDRCRCPDKDDKDNTDKNRDQCRCPDKDDKDNADKNSDRCRCKDKGNCGTVKPPKNDDKICRDEIKSVGGVVVVKVKKVRDNDCVEASTKPHDAAVDMLPSGSGSVISYMLTLTVPSQETDVNICFAAPPSDKTMMIFSSSTGSWQAIKTDVNQGTACADVASSGNYVLVAQ